MKKTKKMNWQEKEKEDMLSELKPEKGKKKQTLKRNKEYHNTSNHV